MPATRELTVYMEDRPGAFGKICRALADRGVNILAFHSIPYEGKSLARLIVDNPANAKTVLDREPVTYSEAEVAQIKLPHRPGGLAQAASRLGEANININYAYSGVEPGTNVPLLFFGVAEVGRAVKILDQAAAAAAGN